MGYFNYFIKCIIRNITYKLFKPKFLFVILLTILILFGLKHFGYCALSDLDYQMISDGFSTITSNQGVIITQLGNIGVDVSDLQNTLNSINTDISKIEENTSNTFDCLVSIYQQINTLNNNITSLMNTVNSNHEELINQLKSDNEKVLNELEEIKSILIGNTETFNNFYFKSNGDLWFDTFAGTSNNSKIAYSSNATGEYYYYQLFKVQDLSTSSDYVFEKGYTYTITSNVVQNFAGTGNFYYTYDNISYNNEINYYYLGKFSQNSLSFTFTPTRTGTINFFVDNFGPFWKDMCHYTIERTPNGSLSSINNGLNNVQDSINQQGENINNSINNSDINVDSSLPTSETNDITLEGFNSIFNTLYNAFTGTSSDVILPIPFTNKSITINYQNVFGGFNFGVLSSIISAFWYFIICLFIVNDIKNKINSIKAGNIENVQTTNIKGDLL